MLNKPVKGATVHKSRLKRKMACWLMVMARVAFLRPEWYMEAVQYACKEYEELIGQPLPWGVLPKYRNL